MGPHLMIVFVPTKLHVAMSFLHPPSMKTVSVSCGVLSVRTDKLYGFVIFVLFFLFFDMFVLCSLAFVRLFSLLLFGL